jgi:hypothetical protein
MDSDTNKIIVEDVSAPADNTAIETHGIRD